VTETIWDRPTAREPRALEFKAGLERVALVTEATLAETIALIPTETAALLARGPKPARYDCAVCDAFGYEWIKSTPCDPEDPRWLIWAYHETPKLDACHNDDQFYGAIANRIYERTIATYRAAGWQGEAPEPNA
jgi:hypothetical protein